MTVQLGALEERTGYYSGGDVTIKFKDKAAAENFKPGDRFWIIDVSPGASFRINGGCRGVPVSDSGA